MKQIALLFSIICLTSFAVQAQKKTPARNSGLKAATVTGNLNFVKNVSKPVKHFKVDGGECVEIASAISDADGNFGFLFYPEYEGLYVIGLGTGFSPNGNYKFYFKPGDHLSVKLSEWSYTLTGTNTKENLFLTQWFQLTDSVFSKSHQF